MRLLKLAPAIQADIDDVEGDGPMLKETVLRKLAGVQPSAKQVGRYRELLAEEQAPPAAKERASRPQRRVRRRGLQHLFADVVEGCEVRDLATRRCSRTAKRPATPRSAGSRA